jgi:hypothetical protein
MKLLHSNAGERDLVLFERFVLCLWVVQYLTHRFEEVAMLPLQAAYPTGLVALLPAEALAWVFDAHVLFGLRVLILTLCFAGLSRAIFPAVAPLLCLAATFELSLVRTFGHVAHAEVPLLLITYVLAAFAVLEWWSDRSGSNAARGAERWATPLVLSTFLFCATYTFVGVVRLTTAPLTVFTGDTMLWSIVEHSSRPWLLDFDAWRWAASSPWIMGVVKVGFPVVTIFELFAPLAMLSCWFRRSFIAVIAGFHVAVVVLMELPFLHHLALLLLLVDWTRGAEPTSGRDGGGSTDASVAG